MKIVHIHAQAIFHDDAWIVGNREGLESLRAAIDEALREGKGSIEAFVVDGEGFDISVIQTDREDLAVPYTDEMASEKQEDVKWPWELLKK
jgi:hypothetical protein